MLPKSTSHQEFTNASNTLCDTEPAVHTPLVSPSIALLAKPVPSERLVFCVAVFPSAKFSIVAAGSSNLSA